MKPIKVLTVLAIGIMASTSGMIQVGATTFNYFVDFSTKEVSDYTAYKQTFYQDTYNLNLKYNFYFSGSYYFDSCPTAFTLDTDWRLVARINLEANINIKDALLPNFPCTTTPTAYLAEVDGFLNSTYLNLIIDDDANFLTFTPTMILRQSAASNGRTLYLSGYRFYFDITYDFGTTYLFNYFLSDQEYIGRGQVGTWTFNGTQKNYLQYVYTTAGNDEYYILNTNTNSIGTTRKKYAIDYNQEFLRGKSVGAGFDINISGTADNVVLAGSGASTLFHVTRYHYLNTANLAQAIVNAPIISFTTQSCSGGFLDINVACFVNNAIAWLVNDAPVISDAFTLLNTGIELAAQTFGIIGAFTDDNVFGYLILIGFGFIAVKWFLKNDN